jgi:hypothetical protein
MELELGKQNGVEHQVFADHRIVKTSDQLEPSHEGAVQVDKEEM